MNPSYEEFRSENDLDMKDYIASEQSESTRTLSSKKGIVLSVFGAFCLVAIVCTMFNNSQGVISSTQMLKPVDLNAYPETGSGCFRNYRVGYFNAECGSGVKDKNNFTGNVYCEKRLKCSDQGKGTFKCKPKVTGKANGYDIEKLRTDRAGCCDWYRKNWFKPYNYKYTMPKMCQM